ncbi:MAG: ATP-binding cassette domain-containing protein, partial [Anaerorhabdus sp.]
ATVLEDIQGNVNCEHVKFGYVEGKEIIHDLSFEALAGKMIAIVGPTGAGKTTIINLLMRFYDVNAGKILVDNHRIDECTRDSLRKQYAMVLQDTWLFSGSIFDNVAYGKDDATIEEVVKVCKAAHVHDFIETLKDGYDTILTDDGVNISKGQKQLLTIARAMLSESKMLILDEATSNVDSRTEMIIQKAMLELCKGKTSFVIAHRLSTIKNADIILVLQNGSVIESGTHEELLQGHGFYSKLFNAQFEN